MLPRGLLNHIRHKYVSVKNLTREKELLTLQRVEAQCKSYNTWIT